MKAGRPPSALCVRRLHSLLSVAAEDLFFVGFFVFVSADDDDFFFSFFVLSGELVGRKRETKVKEVDALLVGSTRGVFRDVILQTLLVTSGY